MLDVKLLSLLDKVFVEDPSDGQEIKSGEVLIGKKIRCRCIAKESIVALDEPYRQKAIYRFEPMVSGSN